MDYVRFSIWSLIISLIARASSGAATMPTATTPTAATATTPDDHVDLFTAKSSGQVNVRLIPHDEKSGQVLIRNNTAGPLKIKLPDAFAAVPILAQFRGGNGGFGAGNAFGGGGGGGATQAVTGGFGQNGGGNPGGIRGGGPGINGGGQFFNIAPERVVKVKYTSVCLEHGKPEPNSRIAYDLVPIESFTNDSAVIELGQMIGRGDIDQSAGQAAAWHLANGLTWQQLASKIGVRHINGTTDPFFSLRALQQAEQAVQEINRRASSQNSSHSPGLAAQLGRR